MGIGANTAIYSVLDTLVLRPLNYPDADRLVQISETGDSGRPNSVSGGAFLDWRAHGTQFEAIALSGQVSYNLRGATATEWLSGLEVSHEFFRVLGVPMLHGRAFSRKKTAPADEATWWSLPRSCGVPVTMPIRQSLDARSCWTNGHAPSLACCRRARG